MMLQFKSSQISRLLAAGVLLFLLVTPGCRPDPGRQSATTPGQVAESLIFAFYNVENLYDTEDDLRTGGDDEFLPEGRKEWDDNRYREKLRGLSQALSDLGEAQLPAVIGLSEVENSKVVEELVAMPRLAKGNYRVIHYDDRDTRGIDQALVYRSDLLSVESHRLIPVRTGKGGALARGLLHAVAKTGNGETFHIFVCHLPSRDGNEKAKETGRKEAANALRKLAEPLLNQGTHTHVVIMGDMNDEPEDESLFTILKARNPDKSRKGELVNLMFPSKLKGHGSYKYQGEWKMLDNLIVSESLMDEEGYRVKQGRGYVFSNSRMEFRNKAGEIAPDRTYVGDKYTGGLSDHFPVFFTLELQ